MYLHDTFFMESRQAGQITAMSVCVYTYIPHCNILTDFFKEIWYERRGFATRTPKFLVLRLRLPTNSL
jgi:hypothetical protein